MLIPFGCGLNVKKTRAANLQAVENPPYDIKNFLSFFPQFEEQIGNCIISNYIEVANNNVNIAKWGKNWEYGMALYIAHLCVLHARLAGLDPENPNLINSSATTGVVASKSVDSVSVSYDTGSVIDDLEGWGDFKLTIYGTQFANLAKRIGFGISVII